MCIKIFRYVSVCLQKLKNVGGLNNKIKIRKNIINVFMVVL